MSDKVYRPEVIGSTPLPETIEDESYSSKNYVGKAHMTPDTEVDKRFPPKRMARELLSVSLNTTTNQILGDYSFGDVGAISVGTYDNGVSGDIRISPDGITARDLNGDTTFSLDGTTGDAVFKGSVTAGAIITGAVEVGDSSIIIDGANIRIVMYDASSIPFLVMGDV